MYVYMYYSGTKFGLFKFGISRRPIPDCVLFLDHNYREIIHKVTRLDDVPVGLIQVRGQGISGEVISSVHTNIRKKKKSVGRMARNVVLE